MRAISRGRIGHPLSRELIWLVMSFILPLNNKKLVSKFEESFAQKVGRKYCTAFPLARVGIYFILRNLNLPKGTKILMPTVSIKGILDVVLDLGLEPIFIDLELETFNWDEKQFDEALGKKPKVAILTYLFGMVPNLDLILKKLKEREIFLIEDFSQAWNANHNNLNAGQFGDASVYSSSSLKSIDTFGGGLVLTNDEKFDKNMKKFQIELLKPKRHDLIRKIVLSAIKNLLTLPVIFNQLTFPVLKKISKGNNKFERFVGARDQNPVSKLPASWFRSFTSLQAKIGLYMLDFSTEMDKKRINIGKKYLTKLNDYEKVKKIESHGNSVFWQFIFIVEDFQKFRKVLQNSKIDTGLTSLINLSELSNYDLHHGYPNAAKLYSNGAYIPCYAQLSDSSVNRILTVLANSNQIIKDA